MKRLHHWLFNFVAAVSVIICVLAGILWVRSYWFSDEVSYLTERLSVTAPGDPSSVRVYRRNWAIYHLDGTIRVYVNREEPISYSAPTSAAPSDRVLSEHWDFHRYRRDRGYQMLVRRHDTLLHRAGFEWWVTATPFAPDGRFDIAFPYWAIEAGSIVVLTTWIVWMLRVRNHRKAGHCLRCGYDLRATPERCPECGTLAAGSAAGLLGSTTAKRAARRPRSAAAVYTASN